MIFGTDPKWLSRLLQRDDSRIAKITIDASAIRAVRHELRDAGITESVIFPDLDGLGGENLSSSGETDDKVGRPLNIRDLHEMA